MRVIDTIRRKVFGPGDEERSFYEAHDALAQEGYGEELIRTLQEQLTWERVQVEEIPFHNSTGLFAADQQTNKQALINAADSTVDQATRAIAERVGQLHMEITREEPVADGRTKHAVQDRHPALQVLYTPKAFMDELAQPLHTYAMQMYLATRFLLTTGEVYFLKIRDAVLTKVTRRISVMPPQFVTPYTQNGRVVAYRITTGDGIWVNEPVTEVIRVWYPDMHNIYQSEGAFEPNAIEYDGRKFAAQHMRSHFERDAIPRVVLEATGENPQNIPEDITDRFLELWKQKYHNRTGHNTGLPFRLPPGWVAKVLNTGRADEHFVRTMEYYDKHLLRAFRVPKSVLGDISDAPARAGVETNQVVFDRYAVLPVTNAISDAFTYQWIGPEYGWDYAIRFPEFIAKDEELEMKKEEADLKNKVKSPNEVRAKRGDPPAEWGEYPVGKFGDMPYKGKDIDIGVDAGGKVIPTPSGTPDDKAPGKNKEPDVATDDRSLTATAYLAKRAWWQQRRSVEADYVPTFNRETRKVMHMQEDACVEAIPRAGIRGPSKTKLKKKLREELEKTLSPSRWRAIYRRMIDPVRRDAFKASGDETMEMLPTSKDFIWTQTAREIVRDLNEDFLFKNLETTRDQVIPAAVDALSAGIEAGDSVSEIAKRIERATRKSFTLRRKDAQKIARTEVGRAAEAASQEGYGQSGVVERKEWNTSLDGAVRSSHLIEGQIVALDEEFVLRSGETAMYPLDPTLPAEDAINCRCFSSPVFEEE